MAENDTHDTLAAALGRHGITLPDDQLALLDRYLRLLWEWNEKINLTRHTDFEKFVSRDVVDSLAFAAPCAEGERVLDVGTGGGVPGVILAIVRPDLQSHDVRIDRQEGPRGGRHRREARDARPRSTTRGPRRSSSACVTTRWSSAPSRR